MVLSILYGITIVAFAYPEFPVGEFPHRDYFYKELSPASLRTLVVSEKESTFVDPDDVGKQAKLPNGHILLFRKDITDNMMLNVVNEYFKVVNKAKAAERIRILGYAFLLWLIPCLGLYLIGYAIGWVRRGFQEGTNRAP